MTGPRMAFQRLREAAADGRLDDLSRRHGVAVLTVFGSVIDPAADAPGDLDVAVKFDQGGGRDVLALLDELAELTGSSDIDLMDLDRADPVARTRALVQAEPLYEAQEFGYAREQLRAVQDFLDTAWLRKLELERLAS